MSSLMKRLRKRAPAGQRRAAQLRRFTEARVFDAERRALFERLKLIAEDFGENDPVRFLMAMRQERRGYDPKHDGKSKVMKLLEEIDELDERERQWDEKTRTPAPIEQ